MIEQIERLEEQKKALQADIRDKYLEAKGVGFDVKALRKLIAARRKSRAEREEEESILAVYMHALGMADGEPDAGEHSASSEEAGRLWSEAVAQHPTLERGRRIKQEAEADPFGGAR
jgi:uncharacterized protein (UPF0335 family)